MSNYIVSARKYRPKTFEDVVGQQALTQTLRNAIASNKLAHAYLFCGPRGVGKTTCARIFAKTINCEHRKPSGEACGECESCRAFDEGRSLNIHELDAASNNSVENIRDITDQVRIPPQIGRYKVFIIDEVHMLSQGAFNAFLKTLEEPPSYVIFILATTEKQKIIPTILSRCQIYDFKRIETEDIIGQLKKISANEGISYDDDALRVIAEKSDGGMRDALSTFDQQVIFTEGNLTYSKVISNLNILDYDYLFAVTDMLLKYDVSNVLLTFDEIISKGFDGSVFIGELGRHMRNLLVSADPATVPLLRTSPRIRGRYSEQASRCSRKFIYKVLKLCRDCELNYRTSRNKRLLVEITLIEIAQAARESHGGQADDKPAPDSDGNGNGHTVLHSIFKDTQKTASPTNTVATPSKQASSFASTQPADGIPGVAAQPEPEVASVKESSPTYAAKNGTGNNVRLANAAANKKQSKLNVVSIRALQKQNSEQGDVTENSAAPAPDTYKEDDVPISIEPYDENKFSVAWLQFSESLPIEESDIAGRMKAIKPELFPDGTVKVKVENPQVEKFMQPMIPRLEYFLQHKLNNRNVRINVFVSTEEEEQPVLNTTEQFKRMVKENPFLSKLNDAFEMEIM